MSLADQLHALYVGSNKTDWNGIPSDYISRLKADQEEARSMKYEKGLLDQVKEMLLHLEKGVLPPSYTVKFPPVDRQVVVSMVEKISNELKDSDDLSLTVTVRDDNEYGSLMAIICLYPVL